MKNIYMKDEVETLYNEAKRLILLKDNTISKLTENDALKIIFKRFLQHEKIRTGG